MAIDMIDRIAPAGKIWVCMACGKTSKDLYGDDTPWWDASCVMNSSLVDEDKLVFGEDRRVVNIKD